VTNRLPRSGLLLSPEARLLLHAIDPSRDPAAVAAVVREPEFDWERLVALAEREKATVALWELLRGLAVGAGPESGSEAGVVPEQASSWIAGVARYTQFRMLRMEQLLTKVLDTLAGEGIDVVLLKGAGLVMTVYGSFSARPMYDLDLLVKPDEGERAWNALRGAGWVHDAEACPPAFYASHYHLPPLDDPLRTGLSVELHTAPTDGAVLLPGELIWKDARELQVHGRRAFVPTPEHQVLHLAAHFAWTHGLASAAWRTFRDLNQLIARTSLDWDAIVRAAGPARAKSACYWTLRLARTLAGIPVPEEVLRALRPPRPETVLKVLERHYAGGLFQFSPAPCPSVRVSQALWSAGMAPRWSGLGAERPWHRGEVWAEAHGMGGTAPFLQRLRGHADRGAQWMRYLVGIFRDGHPFGTGFGTRGSVSYGRGAK